MASYNRIILVGNLTRDPELSYTPSNTAVCKFGIATNRKWKDGDGNQHEKVCFVDCTLFGRSGEVFKQYMSKGSPALVEGKLDFQTWTSQDGQKRSKHEVLVDNFQFLGGGQRSGGGGEGGYAAPAGAPAGAPGQSSGPDYNEPPPPSDDDMPF